MEDADFRRKWRVLLIICTAIMILAPLEYLDLIRILKPGLRPSLDYFPNWLYILYAFPICTVPAYLVILKSWRAGLKRMRNVPMDMLEHYRMLVIIRVAFVQSSFIYNLFIFFMTGETRHMYYFYTIGILLTPFAWPRKQEYIKYLEEATAP